MENLAMSTLESRLKLPAPIPLPQEGSRLDYISFRHPFNNRQFLALPKVDAVLNSDTLQLHTKTAITSCCIIARNKTGFFSLRRDRITALKTRIHEEFLESAAVSTTLKTILSPIHTLYVPSSRTGKFPHDAELADWEAAASTLRTVDLTLSASEMSGAIKYRDQECRTTGYNECIEATHLIPKAHSSWYQKNYMRNYNNAVEMRLDDRRNLIALRRDIKFLLNAGSFVYAPKNGIMRLHCLSECGSYLQYHNLPLSTEHIHIKFLYARFALGIFQHIRCAEGAERRTQDVDTKHHDQAGSRKRKRREDAGASLQVKGQKTAADGPPAAGTVDSDEGPFFSFFADPEAIASPYNYETLNWYPGLKKTERLKEQWKKDHPNIHETQGTDFAESSLESEQAD